MLLAGCILSWNDYLLNASIMTMTWICLSLRYILSNIFYSNIIYYLHYFSLKWVHRNLCRSSHTTMKLDHTFNNPFSPETLSLVLHCTTRWSHYATHIILYISAFQDLYIYITKEITSIIKHLTFILKRCWSTLIHVMFL